MLGVFVWGVVGANCSVYRLTLDEIIWYQHHAQLYKQEAQLPQRNSASADVHRLAN